MMKTSIFCKLLYCLLLNILIFSSCSSDDNDPTDGQIIGKWQLETCSDSQFYEPCDFDGWTKLEQGGHYSEYNACEYDTDTGTWKLEGSKLTITSNFIPIPTVVKVVSLTQDKMVLEFDWGKTIQATYKRI